MQGKKGPLDPLELVSGGCEPTVVAAGTEASNLGYCNSNSILVTVV